ncbi:hypothetical protein TWF730_010431 [Orbilia blumenaviensis]|uniref:Uncharacterized protein n=1 Tax=Orbilia blumenaviensis TaxID=1796055 RepID=A0AAV9UP76_9PEZI
MQMSAPLLRIPLEIRDTIYFSLFDLCQSPGNPRAIYPAFELSTSLSQRCETISSWKFVGNRSSRICYQNGPTRYQLSPILQTCRQIRWEFQDFLRRTLNRSGKSAVSRAKYLRYELDVAAYNRLTYPVWVALPLPPEEPYNVIDELRVNYQLREYQSPRHRIYANGSPGSEIYTLFYLLSDFLFHGPQGFYLPAINGSDPGRGENWTAFEGGRCNPKIKHLILNVLFEERNKKIEDLEAQVELGEPGAETALYEAKRKFLLQKEDTVWYITRHIKTMAEYNYFDGHFEKISIYFEGCPSWCGEDDDVPRLHVFTIGNGFNRSLDWQQQKEFIKYWFVWGPNPEIRRSGG